MNEEVLKICKNYNNIIECEFLDDDVFSKKLVDYYKSFVLKADINNKEYINKIIELDLALNKYIEDYNFCKKLRDSIPITEVISDNFCYVNEFMDYIVSFFKGYKDILSEIVVQTKWI